MHGNGKTCQYCEHWWNDGCPYYAIRGVDNPKSITEPACVQYDLIKDVAQFKDRRALTEEIVIKKQTAKTRKTYKRSLDF